MKSTSLIGSLFAVALLSVSNVGQAQYYSTGPPNSIGDSGPHSRQSDLSVLAWVPWYYGFGIGVNLRYEIQILPDGFLPGINDSFALEPSLGLAYANNYGYGYTDVTPALYGIWSFYFSEQFRLYGGLGLGYNIGIYNNDGEGEAGFAPSYFYWDLCAGVSYKFTPNFGIRGELGSQGIKGGVSFYF